MLTGNRSKDAPTWEKAADRLKNLKFKSFTVVCFCCGKVETIQRMSFSEKESYVCENCEGFKISRKKPVSWEDICPANYRRENVPLSEKGIETINEWQYGPKGLLLAGPTERGKTTLAWRLLKRMFDEGRSIAAYDSTEFSRKVAKLYADSPSQAVDWIESLIAVDVLLLDDLGKGRMTDRVESELFGVVEGRSKHMRPIIVTTNMTGGELSSAMSSDRGEPLMRRFRNYCEIVVV